MSEQEYTGGSVSYYSAKVERPTSPDAKPYTAECNDIIEALGMNYAEGNAFKAIWRSCAARNLGKSKLGYKDGKYDAEKVVFFGQRMVEQAKASDACADQSHREPIMTPIDKANLDGYQYAAGVLLQNGTNGVKKLQADIQMSRDFGCFTEFDKGVLRAIDDYSKLLKDGIVERLQKAFETECRHRKA